MRSTLRGLQPFIDATVTYQPFPSAAQRYKLCGIAPPADSYFAPAAARQGANLDLEALRGASLFIEARLEPSGEMFHPAPAYQKLLSFLATPHTPRQLKRRKRGLCLPAG